MANDLTVRDAVADDIPALVPLLAQLGYPCARAQLEQRFRDFSASPGTGLAVAVVTGAVVGCAAWSRWATLLSDRARFRLDGLVVDAQCRRRGVGRALMAYFEQRCSADAPAVLELTSGVRREKDGSHRFYRALGYANDGLMAKVYLRKDIDPGQSGCVHKAEISNDDWR